MLNGIIETDGFEGCFFVRSHNVLAQSAVGQMVQGRQALCQQEGLLERGRSGDAKRKVLGDGGHGSDGLLEYQHWFLH